MTDTALDLRPCTVCGQAFPPRSDTATVCSPRCALKTVRDDKKARAADRRATRMALLALKSNAQWAREAQTEVNRYVRLRDRHLGCASCDKPATWRGQWHASHFIAVADAPALRFNTWNIAKSCSPCNHHKSGNLLMLEVTLRERIGDERVEWLKRQRGKHAFPVEYLRRIRRVFARRANRLERSRPVG